MLYVVGMIGLAYFLCLLNVVEGVCSMDIVGMNDVVVCVFCCHSHQKNRNM